MKPHSGWIAGAALVGAAGLMVWAETRRPLRRDVDAKIPRIARNLALGAVTAAALQMVERPLVSRLAVQVEHRRWGLLGRLGLPRWLHNVLAIVLMDYTLYVWHVLLHRVPVLWRFHLVHHADRDLDASTALRFHLGEFLLSIPWRLAQIALIGVPPAALAWWQRLTLLEVLFHHANVRLPAAVERRIRPVIVTPPLHGIHHSVVPAQADSNFSSGLTLWDRLHGTLRSDVPQERITIGVDGCDDPRQLRFASLLMLPFRKGQR